MPALWLVACVDDQLLPREYNKTMSAVPSPVKDTGNVADVGSRLAFFKNLQAVTNKIHATANIDEIMLELSQEICNLFNADRLTIYSLGEDKASIVSKIKTGLNSFKDLRLPITDQSIAGYAALSRKIVNIRDVYDEVELKSVHSGLRFLQEVDKRTGYRTKQMLVSPISEQASGELLGVVQIINNKAGYPFAQVAEEGVKGLCETLAIAFAQRNKPAQLGRSKYDFLVAEAVLTAEELDLAKRTARKDGRSIEEVLITEYQVTLPALGAALAKFFNVPYEPFKADRIKPADLLKNLKRDYIEQNHWVPIDDTPEGVVVICIDPEQVKGSRIVSNIFPVCPADSIMACACAASAKAKVRPVTTRIFPASISGHTFASSSCATRVLNAGGRVRSVEPV